MRLLVIEDNLGDFELLRAEFERGLGEGAPELTHIPSLLEGVAAAQHGDFDAVLLDLGLAETRGISTVRGFIESCGDPAPPVVVTTGCNEPNLASQSVRAGAHGYVKKGELSPDALMHVLMATIERHRDFRALEEAHRRAQYQATHCPLTDLPNRYLLEDRTQQAIARAERDRRAIALLMMDLDGFKRVNDRLGHATGDDLLREVAKRLTTLTRATDTLARLGGDEFALLLTSVQVAAAPGIVAEKVSALLAEVEEIDGHRVSVGTSIGIAVYPYDGVTGTDLLRKADEAMYVAKQSKDSYRYATDGVEGMGAIPVPETPNPEFDRDSAAVVGPRARSDAERSAALGEFFGETDE